MNCQFQISKKSVIDETAKQTFKKQICISSKQDTCKLLAKHENVELFEFSNVCLPLVICLPRLIPCAVRKGITCLDKGIPFAAQPPGEHRHKRHYLASAFLHGLCAVTCCRVAHCIGVMISMKRLFVAVRDKSRILLIIIKHTGRLSFTVLHLAGFAYYQRQL